MRFCSLSSCSQFGNAYLVEGADGTRVLVDCGVRIRRLERYLSELGVAPESISALLMTHDHADHVAALAVRTPFAVKYRIPVWATAGFWRAWDPRGARVPQELRRVVGGAPLQIGGLRVQPFAKPHDAADPVSYLIHDGPERLTVLTDLGHLPDGLRPLLAGCEHYILESNYDYQMELRSGRAPLLVGRVLGDYGHLSNDQAAAALAALAGEQTRTVLLAHLSLDCNTPELARRTVAAALAQQGRQVRVEVAPPDRPSPWFTAPDPARVQLRIEA